MSIFAALLLATLPQVQPRSAPAGERTRRRTPGSPGLQRAAAQSRRLELDLGMYECVDGRCQFLIDARERDGALTINSCPMVNISDGRFMPANTCPAAKVTGQMKSRLMPANATRDRKYGIADVLGVGTLHVESRRQVRYVTSRGEYKLKYAFSVTRDDFVRSSNKLVLERVRQWLSNTDLPPNLAEIQTLTEGFSEKQRFFFPRYRVSQMIARAIARCRRLSIDRKRLNLEHTIAISERLYFATLPKMHFSFLDFYRTSNV